MDARAEIANYNKFMDEIFRRMNGAIKAKRLDPMDLRLESNEVAAADSNEVRKRGVRSVTVSFHFSKDSFTEGPKGLSNLQ